MVPRFFTSSSRVMPTPESSMVSVFAAASGRRRISSVLSVAQQLGLGVAAEAQLVQGVGGVGHQLAQEDVRVAVERVDDQLEQLVHLGLELELLGGSGRRHGISSG